MAKSQLISKNPITLAQSIQRRVHNEFDIMMELAITQALQETYKKMTRDIPDGLVSYRSTLKKFQGGNGRYGKYAGIKQKYRYSNGLHFENGYWQAKYLPEMVEFVVKDLLDERTTKLKSKRHKLNDSFKDKQYCTVISMILGIDMLNTMYDLGKLKSNIAKLNIKSHRDIKNFRSMSFAVNAISKKDPNRNDWARKAMLMNLSNTNNTYDNREKQKVDNYEMIAFYHNKESIDNTIDAIYTNVQRLLK